MEDQRAVLGYLIRHSEGGRVRIGSRPIARHLGISRRRVLAALAELERLRLLSYEHTRAGGTGGKGPNRYTLHLDGRHDA